MYQIYHRESRVIEIAYGTTSASPDLTEPRTRSPQPIAIVKRQAPYKFAALTTAAQSLFPHL